MALRGLTIPIISSPHYLCALGKPRSLPPLRLSALRFLTRSNSTCWSNIQGIRSQAMADSSSTVPSVAVFVTVPNKEQGRKLARSIIEAKLAGCVNQVPGIESTYWWQDKIETDSEEMLIIKTRQSLVESLTAHVKANHPYEVCEVIALPIMGGNNDYLKWLKESTRE
ncbi:hypothetical protein SUGI_0183900 [Cryptomeria japonica]|uniref:protein CutA 1, chloroplastic n=1 Tax=Cryptomeria japonica TaxID=3369 RepID=UPI002408BECE|nr:protein CutA 1, chloroplastic [Cryptomeria japonica]GLJ12086.1 hypothetical protein SUGI_0183900 [Cryptomeria japonica]